MFFSQHILLFIHHILLFIVRGGWANKRGWMDGKMEKIYLKFPLNLLTGSGEYEGIQKTVVSYLLKAKH